MICLIFYSDHQSFLIWVVIVTRVVTSTLDLGCLQSDETTQRCFTANIAEQVDQSQPNKDATLLVAALQLLTAMKQESG